MDRRELCLKCDQVQPTTTEPGATCIRIRCAVCGHLIDFEELDTDECEADWYDDDGRYDE